MIEVQQLTKYFGAVLAVDHVSFAIDRGAIVGFLGPNGAGKSTTMRILTTYLPATSGSAKVAGYDVRNQAMEVRQSLGYLPENVPLYPEMRVDEYLQFRAKLKGVDRSQRKQRLHYCIDRCRLTGVQRRLIGTLSRGYRQRVGLAEAMIHDPPILILDEPTAGLDPNQQQDTLGLIRELRENHTIILSTHILPEVEEVCAQVIIIAQGRVVLQDALDQLTKDSEILIEVRADRAEVESVLKTMNGVAQVNPQAADDPGLASFSIVTVDQQDLREPISRQLTQRGWTFRRLDLRRRTLREHFVAATMGRRSTN